MTLFGLRSSARGFMVATLLNASKYDDISGMDCSQAIRVVPYFSDAVSLMGFKRQKYFKRMLFYI